MTTVDMVQLAKTFIAYEQYNKAETVLRNYLQRDEQSASAIDILISVCRIQGKLSELPPLYSKLAALRTHLDAPQTNEPEAHKLPGLVPAPFLIVRDLLDELAIETLLNMAREYRDAFRKSKIKVPSTGETPERRNSLQLHTNSIYETTAMYLGNFVHRELSNCCTRFAIPEFAITKIEYKYCSYPNGSYFRLHRDDNETYQGKDNAENSKRRISFAYYFHRLPKSFSGGDLLIHDTDRLNNRYAIDRYLKIAPENNMLVFFPSWIFHQVTEVMESTGDLLNGRFAINGHIHAAENQPPIAN